MAGQFEIFTDAESNVRFRLIAADGTVLAISTAFDDKRQAANAHHGRARVRRHRADPGGPQQPVGRAARQQERVAGTGSHHHHRHLPAV